MTDEMTLEEQQANHALFQKTLVKSDEAVWFVAKWLTTKGYPVRVNPTFVSPSYGERGLYRDAGDMEICHRLEVKQLGVRFTCREDWPFGKYFMVCSKSSFDQAKIRPWAYVIVSEDQQAFGYVPVDTYDKWYVEKRIDHRFTKVMQDFYFCPIHLVLFSKFAEKKEQA